MRHYSTVAHTAFRRCMHVYQHRYISLILASNPIAEGNMIATGISQVANCQLVRAGRGQQQLLKLTADGISHKEQEM